MLRLATRAMGTRFELVLDGAPDPSLRAAGEAAFEEIDEADRRLSRFRTDSLIAHVNRHAAERPVAVDADTFELLQVAQRVHAASRGAFDVTVGALMRAWGFRDDVARSSATRAPWAGDALRLDPDERTVRFAEPGLELDLGAIGKGHALELAALVLRESGVERALLHGGTSTVLAIGAPPDGAGWRVALEGGPNAPHVDLRDATLSVSAQHGRRNAEGRGHVIDPRSGAPAATEAFSAVVCGDARLADAWSTALLIDGDAYAAPRELEAVVGSGPPGARRWSPLTSLSERWSLSTPGLHEATAAPRAAEKTP